MQTFSNLLLHEGNNTTSTKVGMCRSRQEISKNKRKCSLAFSSRDTDQGRGKRDISIEWHAAAGFHQGQLLPRRQRSVLCFIHRPRCLDRSADGSEQRFEHITRLGYRMSINHGALAVPQHMRCRAVQQPELRVRPDRVDMRFLRSVRHTDARTATKTLPVLKPVDSELREDLVDGKHELVHLLERMSGRDSDAESFLAASDGRVVDGLDVDVMLSQKFIGCSFGQSCITNKDRDNVRGTRSKRTRKSDLALSEIIGIRKKTYTTGTLSSAKRRLTSRTLTCFN